MAETSYNDFIGEDGDLTWPVNGTLDEVRFSNIARAQGYITTIYNNTYSPSTFITFGSELALILHKLYLISKEICYGKYHKDYINTEAYPNKLLVHTETGGY